MNSAAVPFDHTYILYDPSDVVSVACVHLSLLPIYIMVFYTSWFLITREIEPVIVVGGHLIGEVLNKAIKHVVKQPRPDFHKDFGAGSYGLSYGMPSAHSQFMGFFSTYFVCVLLAKVPMGRRAKRLSCVALLAVGVLVAFSRVYLFYHTVQQVFVGVVVGAVLGLAYFPVVCFVRDVGLVDWVLAWPVVRWFWVKDSYYHCYMLFADEHAAYSERRARQLQASHNL